MINYKKLTAAMAAGIIAIFAITGCAMPWQKAADNSSSNVSTVSAGNLSQTVRMHCRLNLTAKI